MSDPKLATYQEIETFWSIDDLFDAHEILDVTQEIKEEQQKEQDRENKTRK